MPSFETLKLDARLDNNLHNMKLQTINKQVASFRSVYKLVMRLDNFITRDLLCSYNGKNI